MGKIAVHEFMALDGVIEDPSWTFDYPFDPKMGEARRAQNSILTPRTDIRGAGRRADLVGGQPLA